MCRGLAIREAEELKYEICCGGFRFFLCAGSECSTHEGFAVGGGFGQAAVPRNVYLSLKIPILEGQWTP